MKHCWKGSVRRIAAATTAVALVALAFGVGPIAATPANAESRDHAGVSAWRLQLLLAESLSSDIGQALESAGVVYTAEQQDESIVREYRVDGMTIGLAQRELKAGGISPRLSVGSNGSGNYIAFNHTDQLAIKNFGVASVAAALCLIAVPVCVVGGVILAGVGTYIRATGFCDGNRVLRAYFEQGIDGNAVISTYRCVQSYAGA